MLVRVNPALNRAKTVPLILLQSHHPSLGGSQHGLEDRGGGTPEGIGGRQTGLVGYPRYELLGLGVAQALGVDAYGYDGRGFGEGRHLFVEPSSVGSGRAGRTG